MDGRLAGYEAGQVDKVRDRGYGWKERILGT